MKKMTVKRLIGSVVKITIAVVVLLFLGVKSLDFFLFTTPAEAQYIAYLGFGLTSGGVIAYLIIFMWDADTVLKRTVAIIMLAVCVLGELATAGFGLQIDAWRSGGFQMTESDFSTMVIVTQLLGFAHAIALIAYMAGDKLAEAFGDHDGDGIPNFADKDYRGNRQNHAPARPPDAPRRDFSAVMAKDTDSVELAQTPAESPSNPTHAGRKQD